MIEHENTFNFDFDDFCKLYIPLCQWEPCTNDYCSGIFTLMENDNNIYAGTDGCGIILMTE